MFPSLSDRTKSLAAVAAMLAVALCNVVFGMDWVIERRPPQPLAAVADVSEAPVVASRPVQAARPAPAAEAGSPPIGGNVVAAPDKDAPRPDAALQMNEPATQVLATPAPAAAAQPKCDVVACAQAYRSFQQSDCTYQPNVGPRRLCTKGAETPAAPAASDARAEANAPGAGRCNLKACTEAYVSFNAGDCTYQPLDGPRRLCEK